MNETLRNWWTKLTQWVQGLEPSRRRNLAIATVASIACVVVLLWMFLRPHYVTIMTGLDNKSLGQVQSKLETLKIPNQINGSSVLVPASQADTARVQLAMAGLPQSGYIGYSSIPNSFGMTQDQFNIQVLNALQDSLDQTIQSIDGIEAAQVHIVMPTSQPFVLSPTSTAKASVFVQIGSGVQLSGAQVAGIQQLVAHSVNGLSIDNVSVVDQNGVTLSDVSSGAGQAGTASSSELAMRQSYEQTMTQQLTSALNQIVGAGNVVVVVHANMTFNQQSVQSEVPTPAPGQTGGILTSQQKTQSASNTTSGQSVGGVAGQSTSNPNYPTYAGQSGTGANSSSSDSSLTQNFSVGKTVTTTSNDPVQISGYTVAVTLNSNGRTWSASALGQIKSVVAKAVGQSTPNNNISVVAMPFQPQSLVTAARSQFAWLTWGAPLAAVVLGGGLFLVMRSRRKKSQVMDIEDGHMLTSNGGQYDPLQLAEDDHMKDQLANLAVQKPGEFANLLRTWLAD